MEKGYKYLQSLFDEDNYDVLYQMIDDGRAHEPFEDRHGYETIFSESMFRRNVDVFRRIIQRDGTEIMHVPCAGREDTAWGLLLYISRWADDWVVRQEFSSLVELLLDAGDPIVMKEADDHDLFKPSYDVWWGSRDAQQGTVSAAIWCHKSIRAVGADGLEEEVGKRMQCVSVWDYEPKIKRGRFF
jgi:hypothetical protein